ncbi:MAG TPA: type IV toxin-antitoxin system AbiEi family antitoxin domain-containing protein [Thermoanaerobaculia bacterium]
MATSSQERLLDLIRSAGVFRSRDLSDKGFTREHLRRLHARGLVEQVGRGLYRAPDADITEHQTLTEAGRRVPHGVICLLSALRFHGMTTQNPFEVWLAIGRKDRLPKADHPPLRVVRFSGEALTEGVEEHVVQGVPVRVYSPAKTVADCFKYRNKIGLDAAIEALRDCVEKRLATFDDLWRYAKICRVSNVMRPYLESIG